MFKTIGTIAVVLMMSPYALAGECTMKIKRTACPGKEAEAFKPYMGKIETTEKKEASDEAACLKVAEDSSKIKRKGTLTGKDVSVSFDGKDLGKTFSDKAECK